MSEKKNLDSILTTFSNVPNVSLGLVQAVVRSAARDTSRARRGLQDLLNETPTVLESLTAMCVAALSPKRLLVCGCWYACHKAVLRHGQSWT